MKHKQRGWRYALSALTVAVAVPCPVWASDTVLTNGRIYTANPAAPWAGAIAISGTRIEAVGSDKAVLRHRSAQTRVLDLKGHLVIPGIIDTHVHTLYGSFALHGINLSTPEASITPDKPDALVAAIKTYAAAHPRDAVILGRADFSETPPTTPTHELLDRAVADRPLVIHNTQEHAVWLNHAAMAAAGLGDEPMADADEERGVIRDASGHPSGVLLEAAQEIAARMVDARLTVEDKLAMLRVGSEYLNRYGITSVVNATGNLAELKLYAALRARGQLTLRTRTSFGAVAVQHHLTPKFLADLEEARNQYQDEWVAANLVKFFADGSSGLIPPLVYRPADYEALVMELDRRGFQIMTHAIRDDSVHMVLDTYERLERAHGARDRRLRIEHLDNLQQEDVARFAKLSVIADMQPTFCCGPDGQDFDPRRLLPSDRWNSLEASGARLAFSSDWPCTWPPDPLVAIQQAVTRQAWSSADTADVTGNTLDGAAQAG
ncbi:MAG: amidohydrolase family protein, partial [Gammaproteobacteria bacterium]|nr:amidohydrolase family protein [Gammaproteobacteria bacterium]